MQDPNSHDESTPIDWESFYANFRKPGFIRGFEILEKLGSGAFGIVYKARKESIGKHYAIKFLKVDDDGVREAVRCELESVRYFAQVDHPNLVSIEDRGEIDGIPYIIMAYAGDSTLRRRIDEGNLGHDEALRLFAQTARGIAALHDRALVHFDIKPANVYLKGDVARIGDYGLSKLVTESCNSLSFGRGTPYYMAPEMLKRRGNHSSDIYSLGVLLYEMLVGRPPFQGDSEWEILNKHETQAPEIPKSVGTIEGQILERCLAKDPADRFTTVHEILEVLAQPLQGLPPTEAMGTTTATEAAAFPAEPALASPETGRTRPVSDKPSQRKKPRILTHAGRPTQPNSVPNQGRRTKRKPINGGRAFMIAFVLCIGTGVLISIATFAGLSSNSEHDSSYIRITNHSDVPAAFNANTAIDQNVPLNANEARAFARSIQLEMRTGIQEARIEMMEQAHDLPLLEAYIGDLDSQSKKLQRLLENFDEYQPKDLSRIRKAVAKKGSGVAPLLVDRMSELDYSDPEQIWVGEMLDKLLSDVLCEPSSYKRVSRRSKRVSAETTHHNRVIVERWHDLVREQQGWPRRETVPTEASNASSRGR